MPSVKKRRYWVVSPNVRNNKKTVSDWRRACVAGRVAFMGWGPDESHQKLGHKFAYEIQSRDIILIVATRVVSLCVRFINALPAVG